MSATRRPAPQAPADLDRARVLAFRAAAHGLHRTAEQAAALPGLALGVQDTPPGSARLALSVRTAGAPEWEGVDGLAAAWSLRGAPHVHAAADLPWLAAALWPFDDADAAARLGWTAPRVRASGTAAGQAVRTVADAVAELRSEQPQATWSKGALSGAVTALIPRGLSPFCRPCGVEHVGEQLLRLATLAGGLAIASTAPLTFRARPGWRAVPENPSGTAELVRRYLHLHGPATSADVRTFLGCTAAVVKACWPQDAVQVVVEGRPAWALADDVASLVAPPQPPPVVLLPPHDPFLKGSDRWLLVPDPALRTGVWRTLGNPGVVLVDAEPAGVWRPRTARGRLTLEVEPFGRWAPDVRAWIDAEAERVAAVRGLPLAEVRQPA